MPERWRGLGASTGLGQPRISHRRDRRVEDREREKRGEGDRIGTIESVLFSRLDRPDFSVVRSAIYCVSLDKSETGSTAVSVTHVEVPISRDHQGFGNGSRTDGRSVAGDGELGVGGVDRPGDVKAAAAGERGRRSGGGCGSGRS